MRQIDPRKARFSQADFVSAVEASVNKVDTQDFWQALKTHIEEQFQQEWSAEIRAQLDLLSRTIEEARQDVRHDFGALSEELYTEKARRLQRQRSSVTLAVEAGIAAATLAILHLPLAVVAIAAAPGAFAWYNNQKAQQSEPTMAQIEYNMRVTVNAWLDEFVPSLLANFRPNLLAENRRIASAAADNYCRQRDDWPRLITELEHWERLCAEQLQRLYQLHAMSGKLLE